ncbi:MAG: tRNA lysidine(34) synthetase TilS [Candidatus Saccharimonadales bacterium]
MKLTVPAGRYVVAVSGGVDSMALLDLLRKQPDIQLTVAHFEHGIREDSDQDRQLVQKTARSHGLPFVYSRGNLGAGASEDTARKHRYEFLHKVRMAATAQAIITAHHQDDMLETAIINLLRGTGRKGLSSLSSDDLILRPLLGYTKSQIQAYADGHNLQWHEDSTNQNEKYLRNYVRLKILNRFDDAQRQQLLEHLDVAKELNQELESLLATQLHIQPAVNKIDRHWFIGLPHSVAKEVLASWLRQHKLVFDKKTLERLVVAAKTYQPHKQADISSKAVMEVKKDYLALIGLDR